MIIRTSPTHPYLSREGNLNREPQLRLPSWEGSGVGSPSLFAIRMKSPSLLLREEDHHSVLPEAQRRRPRASAEIDAG
jgi:hypothetical protein